MKYKQFISWVQILISSVRQAQSWQRQADARRKLPDEKTMVSTDRSARMARWAFTTVMQLVFKHRACCGLLTYASRISATLNRCVPPEDACSGSIVRRKLRRRGTTPLTRYVVPPDSRSSICLNQIASLAPSHFCFSAYAYQKDRALHLVRTHVR